MPGFRVFTATLVVPFHIPTNRQSHSDPTTYQMLRHVQCFFAKNTVHKYYSTKIKLLCIGFHGAQNETAELD